ncbi:hypothetical protein HOJ01_02930 [bacterium]|nr:hypothetical protein [bacterium]MBT6293738.1 hypothetical protein [bacterium]
MTERNKSRATQQNEERENLSFLRAQNDSELSYLLIIMNSRIDLLTNSEQAKTMILTDTRSELDELIQEINGQTQTIDAIRTKQTQLENTISSMIDLMARQQGSEDEMLHPQIFLLKQQIIETTREIQNLKRISRVLAQTLEQEEQEENTLENSKITTLFQDQEKKERLISIIQNKNVQRILPLSSDSINDIIQILQSENFSAEALKTKIRISIQEYENNNQNGLFSKIVNNTVGRELITNIKENIYIFLTTLVNIDITNLASTKLSLATSFAMDFCETISSIVSQDDIENRILERQLIPINNEIENINPNAKKLTLNQIRKLSTLPLLDIEEFCKANPQNPASLVLKRLISNNTGRLNESLIHKLREDENLSERQKEIMISEIRNGNYKIKETKLSTLLAFIDNEEGNQYYDQLSGRHLYYASRFIRRKKIDGRWRIHSEFFTKATGSLELAHEVLIRNGNPELKNFQTKFKNGIVNATQHNAFMSTIESNIEKIAINNTLAHRNAIRNNIQQLAWYKTQLTRELAVTTNAEVRNTIRNYLNQVSEATKIFRVRTAAARQLLHTGAEGKILDNVSGKGKRIARQVGSGAKSALSWGGINAGLMGIPQIYRFIKGEISFNQAVGNTFSNMRYCVPIYGSYLSWRDFNQNPGILSGLVAAGSTILDVAGLPLKLAGLAGRIGFGLVKTAGLRTFTQALKTNTSRALMGTFAVTTSYDFLKDKSIGSTGIAALEASAQILNHGNEAANQLDLNPFQRLEQRAADEIAAQIQTIQAYESNPQLA